MTMRAILIAITLIYSSNTLAQVQMYYSVVEPSAPEPYVFDTMMTRVIAKANAESITTPSQSQSILLDSIGKFLREASYLDSIYYFVIVEHNGEQAFNRINLADTSFFGDIVGSPTWSPSTGYSSTGPSNYLDSNWQPADAPAAAFQAKSAVAFWMEDVDISGSVAFGGCLNSSFNGTIFQAFSGGTMRGAANNNVTVDAITPQGEGLYAYTLKGTAVDFSFNGTSLSTGVKATIAPVSLDFFVGTANVNGTATGGNDQRELRAVLVGSLSLQALADISGVLEHYFNNN